MHDDYIRDEDVSESLSLVHSLIESMDVMYFVANGAQQPTVERALELADEINRLLSSLYLTSGE